MYVMCEIRSLHKIFFFRVFFLGLRNNTFLRHSDLREHCSYCWAYGLDSTTHDSNKYLKQSIKMMLSIRLWKWKHVYFHIYDNLYYMHCQVRSYLNLLFMVKMHFTKFMTSFHDIWYEASIQRYLTNCLRAIVKCKFEWIAVMKLRLM